MSRLVVPTTPGVDPNKEKKVNPLAFEGRIRNLGAVLLSATAVLAIAAYITAPVSARPLFAASYSSARHPMVVGTVKAASPSQARHAHMTLVFRNAQGRVIEVRHASPNRHDRWHVAIPPGAATVTVVVRDEGKVTRLTEQIKPGQSLEITAVLPSNGASLPPGLFPY
ncbi:MAG TPA: hypothetical protein VF770_01010 [Solirubrobacterales bacterium]